MATWVDKNGNATTTGDEQSSGGNISLYLAGGYSNVVRSGNTVTGNIGIRFKMRSSGGNTWTYNTIAAEYGGVKRAAQVSSGSTHTVNGQSYYAGQQIVYKNAWTIDSPAVGYQNTSETTPWSFSATVSGDEAGYVSITISVGWSNWAGATDGSYTFKVPYPAIVKTSLQIREENVDGSWGSYYEWQLLPGDYSSQTWTKTGFEDVSFSGGTPSSSSTVYKDAYRKKFYIDVNGLLDGITVGNVTGYGYFKFKTNDNLGGASSRVEDYYDQHRYGAEYEVYDIENRIGHTYKGDISIKGTVGTSNIEINLPFVTNDIFADCDSSKPGDVYVKVNGVWKRGKLWYNKNGTWIERDG